jgi:disulfide oxidoreductase YuzD
MDPITTAILAALAKLAEPAIKDAYDGLKAIIKRKFGANHEVVQAVDRVEEKPDSSGRRETLKEEIVGSGALADPEIAAAAHSLLEKLKQQPGGQEIVHQIVTGNRNIFSGTGDIHIEGTPP